MQVKTVIATSVLEFKEKLNILEQEGFYPSLAIIFSHSEFDNIDIGCFLTDKKIDFIGCSSAGEIVGGIVYAESISVVFFDMDRSKYFVFKQNIEEEQSYQEGLILGEKAKEKFENPAFISIFGMDLHAECLLDGLRESLNDEPLIYGGMAADDTEAGTPYTFTDNASQPSGFHTIIIDNDQIEMNGLATAGWKAIGIEYTITKGKDNIVYEINNEPALDFFTDFFGLYTNPSTQTHAVSTVNSQYPLQIIRGNETVLRSPFRSNVKEKTFSLTGPIKQGEKFKFSIAPSFDVIEDTIKEFNKFKENMEGIPDAVILFSCKARHWAFGPMIEDEVEALGKLWDVPFHGFFCFGELGKNKDKSVHFFNETCCLMTLKDKQS